MKPSLQQRILNYLTARKGWINSGEIERLALGAGYKSSNSGRRCRELQNDGLLEVEYRHGIAWYRAKEKQTAEEWFDSLPDKK